MPKSKAPRRPNPAAIVVVAGASQSGKTSWTMKQAGAAPRVFVWDIEDQWSKLQGFQRVTGRAELAELCQAPGPLRVAYVTGGDLAAEFGFWCRCVFYAGRFVGPLVAVAEELSDVSTPAKAPGAWGIMLRRGLKRGITIYAISQRWAEADKTAIGNATRFVIFRTIGEDTAYMARKTGAPLERLAALKPLEFVQVDAGTGAVTPKKRL